MSCPNMAKHRAPPLPDTIINNTFWSSTFHSSLGQFQCGISLPGSTSFQTPPTAFSLEPSYRRGRVYKLKFCLFVCLSVIASIFPIYGLQIIPESYQTPHTIHHWKEDDISDDNDNDKDTQKDKYEDKDKDKYKMPKRPITCYIFEKQGVQGYQI